MSGQRGNVGSKRPREVFLTSTSLSFSSLSSSCTSSSEDVNVIEISNKASRASYVDQIRGKLTKAYSPFSETLCVRMEPAPSPRPVQLMNICLGEHYDPERIPASVFAKTGGGEHLNWSKISSGSLFSLRMSTCQAFRQSNINLGESEFLAFSPSLLEDAEEEEKRSQVKDTKSVIVMTSVKTNIHRERSSTSTPRVSFDQLYQAPQMKSQAFSLPLGEKENKKRKKTVRSKKTNKKKEQSMCRIWSWLCSGVSKCNCNLSCCYRWKKCSCGSRRPKAMVL